MILPCESKNQHCDEKGVSSRNDFGWYEAFLPARRRKNQERSAWLDAADYDDWKGAPQALAVGEFPKVAAIL